MKTLIVLLTLCAGAYPAEMDMAQTHFYIQPDIGWRALYKGQNESAQWESWGKYYGLNIRYEVLKPDDIYAGAEAYVSHGSVRVEGSDDEIGDFRGVIDGFKSKIEGRVGQAIRAQNFTLIPFLGFGDYAITYGDYYFLNATYIPFGIKAQYSFQNLDISLQYELLKYFQVWYKTSKMEGYGNVLFVDSKGYEISLPLLFRIEGKWDASLEPYYLHISDDFTFFGTRFALGCKF